MHHPAVPHQEDVSLQGKQLWHPHKGCTATNKQQIGQPWQRPSAVPRTKILHMHHTTGKAYPIRFYVFKDPTNLSILISYAASDRLGILNFNLSNVTNTAQVNNITTQPTPQKHVTFSTTNTNILLYKTIHHRTIPFKTMMTLPSKIIL